jgi:hypothetical protein
MHVQVRTAQEAREFRKGMLPRRSQLALRAARQALDGSAPCTTGIAMQMRVRGIHQGAGEPEKITPWCRSVVRCDLPLSQGGDSALQSARRSAFVAEVWWWMTC